MHVVVDSYYSSLDIPDVICLRATIVGCVYVHVCVCVVGFRLAVKTMWRW